MSHPFGRPRSIAARLLVFSALFVTLTLLIAGAALWVALETVIRDQIDQRLDTQLGALASALKKDASGSIGLTTPLDAAPFDRLGSGWYWQVDAAGQHLKSRSLADGTIDAPPVHQDLFQILTTTPASGTTRQHGQNLHIRKVAKVLDGATVLITVSAPQAALTDPAFRALLWMIPAVLVLGGVLLVGTIWQVRFGLRPIVSMASQIADIEKGERSRLSPTSTAELDPLVAKTNALLQSSEERLAATRMQFANLAHGLKTPISSLLLAIDDRNDPDGALRDLVTRIDNRVRHHLASARRAMAPSGIVAKTSVNTVIADLQGAMGKIYGDRGLSFNSSIPDGMIISCDQRDCEEMFGNLLDNAYKFAGTSVSVSAGQDGRLVEVRFEDDGPGIPQHRLEAVLQPGVREDERIEGSGFGLSIVSELVALYGGYLVLENRKKGGLSATLRLPTTAA